MTCMTGHIELGAVLHPDQVGLFTDHSVVPFSLKDSVKKKKKTKSPTRSVSDYRRGDFEGLRSALQSVNLSNVVQDNNTIDQDWTFWKDTFLAAAADFIPLKTIRKRNGPPWLTGDMLSERN